jgi:hypothetical protein
MARGLPITDNLKKVIFSLRKRGFALKDIAETIKCSVSGVSGVLNPRATSDAARGPGRPKTIVERTERKIVRGAANGLGSAERLRDTHNIDVSVRTVQRYLQEVPWLKYKKIRRVPMLERRHIHKRLEWARQHDGLDEYFWANVAFSDEKKWTLDGPDGLRQ